MVNNRTKVLILMSLSVGLVLVHITLISDFDRKISLFLSDALASLQFLTYLLFPWAAWMPIVVSVACVVMGVDAKEKCIALVTLFVAHLVISTLAENVGLPVVGIIGAVPQFILIYLILSGAIFGISSVFNRVIIHIRSRS